MTTSMNCLQARRANLRATAVVVSLGALVMVGARLPFVSGDVRAIIFNAGRAVTVVVACLALLAAARTGPPVLRRSHRLLAYAFVAGMAGNLLNIGYVLMGIHTSPSLVDVAYASYVPLTAAALIALPLEAFGDDSRRAKLRMVLDGAVAASALVFVSQVLVLAPVWHSDHLDSGARLVAVWYAVADVFLATLALSVIARVRRPYQHVLRYAVGGLLLLCVSSSLAAVLSAHGHAHVGNAADLMWEAAAVLLLLGALRARTAGLAEAAPPALAPLLADTLPYLPVALALAVAAERTVSANAQFTRAEICAAITMVVALLARQARTVVDNRRLAAAALRSEQLVREKEEYFRSLVWGSTDLISVLDEGGVIRYRSPAGERLLAPSDQDSPVALIEWIHPDDRAAFDRAFRAATRTPDAERLVEHRIRHPSGEWLYVETSMRNQLENPSVRGVILNTRDVHERRKLQERLTHLAFHDPLTELANRTSFRQRAAEALRRRPDGLEVAVVLIDLDGFKAVNDTVGHPAGDSVLVATAAGLRASCRDDDLIARLGGDEFAVLIEDSNAADAAAAVAARIIERVRPQVVAKGCKLAVTSSVGYAHTAGELSAEELIANADLALYSAKQAGKACTRSYTPDMRATAFATSPAPRGATALGAPSA